MTGIYYIIISIKEEIGMSQKHIHDEENITLLEKGKRGLFRIIFGRTTLILVILAAQFVMLFVFLRFLGNYIPYLFGGVIIFNLYMVIYILNSRDVPEIKLSWIVLVLLSPALGALLYVFVTTEIGHRRVHAALAQIDQETARFARQDPKLLDELEQEDRGLYNMAGYLMKNGNYPVYRNTSVKYFPSGKDKFEELVKQLEEAKSFIFLEYFILAEGYMWGRILNILQRKVKEGVEVRVMYDGMCAVALLPYEYPKELEKLGIKSKMFAPILPFISTHYNNRDHRKILVIDGKVAFTGGINLADEYIDRKTVYGYWKDTAIMVQGDAVRSFTLMFLRMWNGDRNMMRYRRRGAGLPEDDYERYLNVPQEVPDGADGYVIPYGDTPYDDERVGEMVYLDIINQARKYVHIMTPYLILDSEMLTALTYAAKRGVDVRIILPHIPDKKYAFALAKTHYRELITAGVKLYEFTPGFVHAKVFVSDDVRGVVGTINLDYRSLYLHFECAAYLHQVSELGAIERDFQNTMEQSHQVTPDDIRNEKLSMKAAGRLLKLIAPLM